MILVDMTQISNDCRTYEKEIKHLREQLNNIQRTQHEALERKVNGMIEDDTFDEEQEKELSRPCPICGGIYQHMALCTMN